MNSFDRFIAKYSIYLFFLRRMIGKVNTVLDLGCANGKFMQSLSYGKNWEITGVDLDSEYLKKAANTKVYKKLIRGDVIKTLEEFIKGGKKWDLVFCSQVIEHLNKKDGKKLLKIIEKVTKKRVFISTPNGFREQDEKYLDHNVHQIHKSGWHITDFEKKGYRVRGANSILYFTPSLASGLFCIKIIE